MLASPASTTVRTSNGSTSSWSEWMLPEVYCASRIARGPNRVPGRWLTASSNGAPTIATSTPRRRISAGSVDPRQLHERDRPDVGRQVEVGVRLELAGPSRCGTRTRMSGPIRWALGHEVLPETVAASVAAVGVRLAGGAAGSNPSSSGARRGDGTPTSGGPAAGQVSRRGTPPRPRRPAPGPRTARTRSGRRGSRPAA